MFYDKVGMFIVVFEEPFLIKYIIVYKKLNMEIQKTNIKINDYPNIYIDRDNHFKLPTKNGIYPCIIQLSDGKLLNYSFQSPTSAAFFTLEKNKK